MATNTLNTRIQLKYDSYTAWEAVKETFKPLKGEICIVNPGTKLNDASAVPCLMKVGDGENFWKDLPWVSAIAADVYAWAKRSTPDWNDFPALPIEVIDEGTGKFVTDFTYADNKLTITRSDVEWTDVKNAPEFALKSELPTALGVMSVDKKDGSAIEVDNDTDAANPKVGLKIAETQGANVTVSQSNDGLKVEVDTGVHAVTLATGSANGKVKLTVDGADTEAEVYGLKALAFQDKITENDIEGTIAASKITNFATEVAAVKVTDAAHADAAGKVDNAITVKVGGADVVFDGSAAKTADVDAAIAAAIAAEGHPEYNIVKDSTSEYAATYHLTKDGVNVGAAINIPKDLVVESGKVETLEAGVWGEAGTYIILTLANATNDKIYVNVGSLIEYVTSGSTADSQVIVAIDENHKVTATIGAGKVGMTELSDEVKAAIAKDDDTTYDFAKKANTDLTFTVTPSKGDAYDVTVEAGALATKDTVATSDIEDKAVTEDKLADTVIASLNKEWQPVGDYKVTQIAVENKITDAAHVLTSLIQNENGEIAYEVKQLTPADIGAQPIGDYATKTEVANQNAVVLAEAQEYADNRYTAAANGGLKLNEDKSFAIDDTITFVFNCGSATTVID